MLKWEQWPITAKKVFYWEYADTPPLGERRGRGVWPQSPANLYTRVLRGGLLHVSDWAVFRVSQISKKRIFVYDLIIPRDVDTNSDFDSGQ